MESEVKSISKAMENPKKPCVFIAGGAKPESFKVKGIRTDDDPLGGLKGK